MNYFYCILKKWYMLRPFYIYIMHNLASTRKRTRMFCGVAFANGAIFIVELWQSTTTIHYHHHHLLLISLPSFDGKATTKILYIWIDCCIIIAILTTSKYDYVFHLLQKISREMRWSSHSSVTKKRRKNEEEKKLNGLNK